MQATQSPPKRDRSAAAQRSETLTVHQRLSPRHLVGRFAPVLARAGSMLTPFVSIRPGDWDVGQGPGPLGRLGTLEVRLAATDAEIRRAQALRYQVFYDEMSATANLRMRSSRRDADRFDRLCDHLIVIDHASRRQSGLVRQPAIVGTYRLLRQEAAGAAGGFYSAGEFDIAPLVSRKANLRFLELGRSCVLPRYRNKRTLELLWHGVWAYVLEHRLDVMIGCASLEGTEPERLAAPLSFLHHHARAPEEWRVRARDGLRVDMDMMPRAKIDAKAALRALPPLIKGYLRLGAMVGDGAVIDRQFGTTDVFVVLPVAAIASRYLRHFGADAGRYALRREAVAPPVAA
jgi:putative hemolysin